MNLRPRHLFVVLVASGVLVGAPAVPAAGAALPTNSELVKIVHSPPTRSANPTAVFRTKRVRNTKMKCRVDRRRYRSCQSRVVYRRLKAGKHIFRVRASRNGQVKVRRHRWTIVKRGAPLPPAPAKLRFADEFNGTSLDTTQWAAWHSPGYLGHGLRRRSAFQVSGGNLILTAQMVDGKLVSGGMSHRQDYTYGRYQFRVRVDKDPTATMSAIVMTWPKHQRSPDFTENDIYETGPVADRSELDSYIHYGKDHKTQKLYRHKVNASEWHTMTMDWRKDELLIYRDGKLAWAVTDRYAIPDVLHHMCIQLDARFERILKDPVKMYVDYVRIWE